MSYYAVVVNEFGEVRIGNHVSILGDMAGFADLSLQKYPLKPQLTFKTFEAANSFLGKYGDGKVRKVLDDEQLKRIMIHLALNHHA